MSGIRLVPRDDDTPFPYEEAKRLILIENPSVQFQPADLQPMIDAGKRMGWPDLLVRANEELAERGNCFEFEMFDRPYLRGTLYEDNVFLTVDPDYSEQSEQLIKQWATSLGVEVFRH